MNIIECRIDNPRTSAEDTVVTIDGVRIDPGPSLNLRNHSPTGFAWGYGGSGPAQLALAILLHVTGDAEVAERHYQAFKFDHVVHWGPWGENVREEVDVAEWVKEQERLNLSA